MIDISIIILTYNQKDLTRQTLQSVQSVMQHGQVSIQTIVTDNASTDGVLEMVRSEFPWVEIVANNENLGFSAGNNRGVEHAKGKYVLFLNSDTQILGDVLPVLIERMERDTSIGIATCRVELANGQIDPACHRGFPTPFRALTYYLGLEKLAQVTHLPVLESLFGGYHLLESRNSDNPHEIDACTGAFLLLRRSLGEELSWWDEQFFMYGEDIDLCYRVKQKGLKVMFYPDQKILHYKHSSGLKVSSSGVDPKKLMIKRKTTAAFYDAMKLFYRKHYKTSYPYFVQQLVFIGIDVLKWFKLRKITV